MSIIKSIKQVLGLHPAAENHFFDASVPNELTLKRGTPDAPGDTVMGVVGGKVTFPQMLQTWQDVTASRSLGTVYTNDTGQPIDVSTNCSVTVGNGSSNFAVGSDIVSSGFGALNVSSAITYARVPAGATYRLDNAFGTVVIFKWMELRA